VSHIELTPDLFEREVAPQEAAEVITRPSLTYWQDAWRRFRKNKLALVALGVLGLITIMAIVGPYMRPYSFSYQDLDHTAEPPNRNHWFGTDELGRDNFVRLWMGARISLFIGIMAALLDMLVGVTYGGISAYFGGWVDDIMQRFIEILYAIPMLLLMILLMVVIGPGLSTMILVMVIGGWVGMARLVRGQIFQLKAQEFVLAARVLGASPSRIIIRHLLPNAMGPIIVSATMTIPGAIFFEAFMSFIGLGIPMPLASWGTLANTGYEYIRLYPWLLIFPGAAIAITMLAFNIVGDALRDALDPRLRQ